MSKEWTKQAAWCVLDIGHRPDVCLQTGIVDRRSGGDDTARPAFGRRVDPARTAEWSDANKRTRRLRGRIRRTADRCQIPLVGRPHVDDRLN